MFLGVSKSTWFVTGVAAFLARWAYNFYVSERYATRSELHDPNRLYDVKYTMRALTPFGPLLRHTDKDPEFATLQDIQRLIMEKRERGEYADE
jgi:hypothetical protein